MQQNFLKLIPEPTLKYNGLGLKIFQKTGNHENCNPTMGQPILPVILPTSQFRSRKILRKTVKGINVSTKHFRVLCIQLLRS